MIFTIQIYDERKRLIFFAEHTTINTLITCAMSMFLGDSHGPDFNLLIDYCRELEYKLIFRMRR